MSDHATVQRTRWITKQPSDPKCSVGNQKPRKRERGGNGARLPRAALTHAQTRPALAKAWTTHVASVRASLALTQRQWFETTSIIDDITVHSSGEHLFERQGIP